MKIKLLKEIRKRYGIFIYPNGFRNGFLETDKYSLVLKDEDFIIKYLEITDGKFYVNGSLKSENIGIQYLKDKLLKQVLHTYQNKGVRRIKHQQKRIKVYYNGRTNKVF